MPYISNKSCQLQNITAYFTVLKIESKFCFMLCMDTEKAIWGRNKPSISNFLNSQPQSIPCSPGQFIWVKPAPEHDFWSNAPGLLEWGGGGSAWN